MEIHSWETYQDQHDAWYAHLNVTLTNNRDEDYKANPKATAFLRDEVRDPEDNELVSQVRLYASSWTLTPGESKTFSIDDRLEFNPDPVRFELGEFRACNPDDALGAIRESASSLPGFLDLDEFLEGSYYGNWLGREQVCNWTLQHCVNTDFESIWTNELTAERPELFIPGADVGQQYSFNNWLHAGGPGYALTWDLAGNSYSNFDHAPYATTAIGGYCSDPTAQNLAGPGWVVDARDLSGPQVWMGYRNAKCVSSEGIGYAVLFFDTGAVESGTVAAPSAPERGHCDEHNEWATEPLKDRLKRKFTPTPVAAVPLALLGAALLRRKDEP